MNGPDNYVEAERLLADVERTPDQYGEAAEYCRQQLAAAQVHATLALAAATAYRAVCDYWSDEDLDTSREWAGVAS
jgi:hypothetical protein